MQKGELLWNTYGWFNLLCRVVEGGWFTGLAKTADESAMVAPLYRTLAYLDRDVLKNKLQ